ncbi:MAG: T9SS type A sorting domain-containing protein [Bacteroidales bacterium]|nr:T9SS type A sorting domain-containing protein [Bacteroidales bacterium]
MKALGTFILLLIVSGLSAQLYFSDEVSVNKQAKIFDSDKNELDYPWTGGMNSCQFSSIDADLDGKKDLFVFDRHGNRIMIFINMGDAGQITYQYAPEYSEYFPELTSWAILIDYNNDGLEDIFTYSAGYAGIKVYKNVSGKELDFELEVWPYLKSFQGGGYTNILVTDVDYPGISDIDQDGDLDILTFWGLGSFVEFHKNLSIEKYGIPDSLDYSKTTSCWGYFAENEESNIIYLDTCFSWESKLSQTNLPLVFPEDGYRHTGSTFLLIDLNNDGIKDLVLGDVDYPNLIGLTNGGTQDSAYMISQNDSFPAGSNPVNIFGFPLACYIDVDNNGIKDLIVSPFDPGLYSSKNHKSTWLYLNYGSNTEPSFNYIKDNFIQQNMIDLGSGAFPVLFDYNGDGLTDIFAGNYGYYDSSYYLPGMLLKSEYIGSISFYRNTGTTVLPEFTLVTADLGDFSEQEWSNVYPAIADLDGDNDADFIVGTEEGDLYYAENTAGPGADIELSDPFPILVGVNKGEFLTPQLFDIDLDGLPDLIFGEKAGNLNYYRNTGTLTNPQFTYITDSLGKVNVTDPNTSYNGFSTPCFFKNQEGIVELLVGSEQGKIFYFTDIQGNLLGEFFENDSIYKLINDETFEIKNGIRTSPAISDLSGNGYLDLIVGNFSGGLNYYSGVNIPNVFSVNENTNKSYELRILPNPAKDFVKVILKELTGVKTITVLDIYGETVFQIPHENREYTEFFVGDLSPGIYIIRVEIDSKVFYGKLLVL